MHRPIRRLTHRHATCLRRERTEAEDRFWYHVRNRALADAKFRFQASIGPYVVDFLCIEAGLIVEIDGSQHSEEADAQRTAYLEERGYEVLRYWNNDVLLNIEGVLTVVLHALERRRR
jgi:very-short-patch-repair endonuclease